jgi:hypothetical protein
LFSAPTPEERLDGQPEVLMHCILGFCREKRRISSILSHLDDLGERQSKRINHASVALTNVPTKVSRIVAVIDAHKPKLNILWRG